MANKQIKSTPEELLQSITLSLEFTTDLVKPLPQMMDKGIFEREQLEKHIQGILEELITTLILLSAIKTIACKMTLFRALEQTITEINTQITDFYNDHCA